MSAEARWIAELEAPTGGFFEAFAARAREPEGARDAVREALKVLVPRLDWEAYLPHMPHGVLGLRAVWRLEPLLSRASFLRALAIQLHMAAHEGRRTTAALSQVQGAKGSGDPRNLLAFIQSRRPGLAYAEAQGVEAPEGTDFGHIADAVRLDMACVGHKLVAAEHLSALHTALGAPRATGRRLLGLAAWMAATPEDAFWARRTAQRLGPDPQPLTWGNAPAEVAEARVREVCDLGLVGLLDALTARLKAGQGGAETLATLALAASEKQLDARRDLEGKTAWSFVYLATLAQRRAVDPRLWCQAAALINLFPTDEPEERVKAASIPRADADALREAVLDAEARLAMAHARGLVEVGLADAALGALAEAATRNDPAFNHAHQLLAVAAAVDLQPHLSVPVFAVLLEALAKNLANSQGSDDLGRQADRALGDA